MPTLGNRAFHQAYARRKQIGEACSEWTKASHQCSVSGAAAKRVANSNKEDKTVRPQAPLHSEVAKHCVNEATNCRRWEVGLQQNALLDLPVPWSPGAGMRKRANHSSPVASDTTGF